MEAGAAVIDEATEVVGGDGGCMIWAEAPARQQATPTSESTVARSCGSLWFHLSVEKSSMGAFNN